METIYQDIFDVIQEILPDDWKKIILYAQYSEDSYSMKLFVDKGNNAFIDYLTEYFDKRQLLFDAFGKIDGLICLVRDKLPQKDKWYVMTFIVDADGGFNAKYDYTDVSDNRIEYYKKWKKQYVG